MRAFPTYLLLLVLIPAALSCQNGKTGPGSVPPTIAYEDSVYCFNQRSIVQLQGKKGLVDVGGRQILAPEWDSIEFLDDEVALLSRSGKWFLCTLDGRLFAEGEDKALLEESFRARLDRMRDVDYRFWEEVLTKLDALGEACLSSKSRRPDAQLRNSYAELLEILERRSGEMSKEQKERFEQIVSDFNANYRR